MKYEHVVDGSARLKTEKLLAAVVVAFNPDESLVENIGSYGDVVGCLYVCMNSQLDEKIILALKAQFGGRLAFIGDGENLGLGAALNAGCEKAKLDGYEWVLTMDQDSIFSEFSEDNIQLDPSVGLYYPEYILRGKYFDDQLPPWVMTSGNIINLQYWCSVGGFNSDYFIDAVDFDYCIRLMSVGGDIRKNSNLVLNHELGEYVVYKSIGPVRIRVTHHKPFRYYYFCRNYTLVAWKCFRLNWRWSKYIYRVLLLRLVKSIIFEERKGAKLKYAFFGFLHAATGVRGAMPDYLK